MKRELNRAKRNKCRIIYLDETMFTRATVPKAEYCLPKDNMTVDTAHINEPTLALLSGISRERGQELFMLFERSVNIAKFKQYLAEMREKNGDDQICLFMDNLSTHTSEKSKAEMRRLGFRYIYNVPYTPDFNPIEFVFSKIKQKFKTLRAQKLTGVTQDDHEALIRKAVKAVRKKDIVNSIDHV
jgi:transposase